MHTDFLFITSSKGIRCGLFTNFIYLYLIIIHKYPTLDLESAFIKKQNAQKGLTARNLEIAQKKIILFMCVCVLIKDYLGHFEEITFTSHSS